MNLFWFLVFVLINFISIKCDDEVYQWDAENYPNLTSTSQAKYCTGHHRNPPSSVCDPDYVLKRKEAKILDQLIDDVRNDTKCICDSCPPSKPGLNIKLALVKFIKVFRNASIDKTVEIFAERTRRKWRFGEDCSNDVLIFCSALDDKIFISMGSRARKVLEENINTVLKETRSHFTSGHYYQGLESIIASLQDLSDNYSSKKSSKLSTGSIALIVICVSFAIIIVLCAVFWFFVNRERNSLSGSFEFIGSWGRNKNKNKAENTTRAKPKVEPIYKPVHTIEKIDTTGESTLPISDRGTNA